MKKIFIIVAILVLIPITVNAATINTSFDENECVLTVSGTQSGHEAQVSLFINNEFKGMNTNTIENGNYEVEFTLMYDSDTTIDLTVADELGTNKYTKENVLVPACTKTNTNTTTTNNKVTELFDNQGNSIIINDANVGFLQTDYLDLGIRSKEDIETLLEQLKQTDIDTYNQYKSIYDKVLAGVGDNEFLYYIEAVVRNEQDGVVDYSNYDGGFILNLLYPKDEYKKLKGLKLALADDNTFAHVKTLNYTYDEVNESFIIELDTPGVIIAYLDKTESGGIPKTGDSIMFYILMLGLSVMGFVGIGIYTKNRKFN